ncbi:FAD-dependent oxidoreductase [Planosporangium mesophilum]|nr:FAD-dependent oxidoreductase [Planosporangium mesophilum]NJC86407.1 FAD-dependent oxidoreductase [Planosporangium mesophilum]
MRPKPEVLVIGAGVSGLTTALLLAKNNLRVRIWTRDALLRTTSCAAGALWGPYLVSDQRVLPWATQTRLELERLAVRDRSCGVRVVYGHEAARTAAPPPGWATELPGFRTSRPDELPAGFTTGWWYRAPIVDMPTYLRYLYDRFTDCGGKLDQRAVGSLAEAVAEAPVVVNCAGYDARNLVPDASLRPTRGQIVVVDDPGIEEFFAEHDESEEPTYILPQHDHGRVVLGGSVEPGRTDRVPDERISTAIRRRCAEVMPALRDARVVEVRVGLRPTRSRVRLERTAVDGGHVIHNYGHGGGGVTLSWGCAHDVLSLINAI